MQTGWNPNHYHAKRSIEQIIARSREYCACGKPALYQTGNGNKRRLFCADHREDAVRAARGKFA